MAATERAPASAAPPAFQEPATIGLTEIPQTSLAQRGTPPGEVTVQFRRFTPHGTTAYQKGQFAGFMAPVAEQLIQSGCALLVTTERASVAGRMVTK